MDKFRIGNTWYDVTYRKVIKSKQGKLLLGDIDFDNGRIRICNKFTRQTMLQTKFHECTHGLFQEYGVDGDEDDVCLMTSAFYGFIIDNSEFIKDILKFAEGVKG